MAHFAGPKFAARFRFDVDLEQLRENLRHFANWRAFAAPDVNRQSIELVAFGCEQVRARDVFDEREIACLLTIFVKHRRQIVE